jgi:hypothetical protein
MKIDPVLAERLSKFPLSKFDGQVYRATRVSADPTAPSLDGGRWSKPPQGDATASILYTSMQRDGAVAEVASFLTSLTPIPARGKIKVSVLSVTLAKTIRLKRNELEMLGVDLSRYGDRDYGRTQEIGSTLAWLNLDGLIAPSARWNCDNLMIFSDNHGYGERLDVVGVEEVEWRAWAHKQGMLDDK